MTNRWTYGDYQFAINPSSHNTSYEVVGDDVRTLSGAFISQPSAVVESHKLSGVIFQPRSRVISEISIPNGLTVKYYTNSYYVLNKVNDRIDIYSSNLTSFTSISLSGLSIKDYIDLDVSSDGIWICSDNGGGSDVFYKLNLSGQLQDTKTLSKTKNTTGITTALGYIWVLKYDGSVEKVRVSDFAKVASLTFPQGLYYKGIDSENNFIFAGNNDSNIRTIFHLDCNTGATVNAIEIGESTNISSVTKDTIYYYTYNSLTSKIQKVNGNTAQLDAYSLEMEIKTNRFVTMTDDMGINKRVYVGSFSIQRRLGYEHMYDISLDISKVNRG